MSTNTGEDQRFSPFEARQIAAAARAAAAIGGPTPDADPDPSQRPLAEAGVAEGFELAEHDLIEAAEHCDSGADPLADAFTPELDRARVVGQYGEARHADSSEVPDSDR